MYAKWFGVASAQTGVIHVHANYVFLSFNWSYIGYDREPYANAYSK